MNVEMQPLTVAPAADTIARGPAHSPADSGAPRPKANSPMTILATAISTRLEAEGKRATPAAGSEWRAEFGSRIVTWRLPTRSALGLPYSAILSRLLTPNL